MVCGSAFKMRAECIECRRRAERLRRGCLRPVAPWARFFRETEIDSVKRQIRSRSGLNWSQIGVAEILRPGFVESHSFEGMAACFFLEFFCRIGVRSGFQTVLLFKLGFQGSGENAADSGAWTSRPPSLVFQGWKEASSDFSWVLPFSVDAAIFFAATATFAGHEKPPHRIRVRQIGAEGAGFPTPRRLSTNSRELPSSASLKS